MSKLVDKLRKISQGEAPRIGFGNLQATASKIPAMAIVASLPRPDADLAKTVRQAEADAILIRLENLESELAPLRKTIQVAGDIPCGVKLEAALPEDIGRIVSAGADFLALHTETAPSAFLRREEIGRLAAIDPYLDDSLLRTINRLAVDAVVVELEQGNEEFLTVREVMACRRAVDMINKPLILRVSDKLSAGDLRNLWDLGIASILVTCDDASAKEMLERLHAAIAEFPPRRRGREGVDVMLPRQSLSPKVVEPEDDEL